MAKGRYVMKAINPLNSDISNEMWDKIHLQYGKNHCYVYAEIF